ncbi:hypothetical protein HY224_01300 [Candidatus Uhrbacteria bacterium]|nr:hypothetical protein [Candidatus Uhrbacteria bacterium]
MSQEMPSLERGSKSKMAKTVEAETFEERKERIRQQRERIKGKRERLLEKLRSASIPGRIDALKKDIEALHAQLLKLDKEAEPKEDLDEERPAEE